MLNVLSAACFAAFLLAALAVLAVEKRQPGRRWAVNAFLLVFLSASFGAGFTQHDAWPFAKWALAATPAVSTVTSSRIVGLDGRGLEHNIDHRVWEPLATDELLPWMQLDFTRLGRPEQDRLAVWLLDRAESARLRARTGVGVGYLDRFLGPFAAPRFLLHPRFWAEPSTVPPEPFVGLRVYLETWDVEERAGDAGRFSRVLLYEYRRP